MEPEALPSVVGSLLSCGTASGLINNTPYTQLSKTNAARGERRAEGSGAERRRRRERSGEKRRAEGDAAAGGGRGKAPSVALWENFS